jgi:hypothetical protein
MEELKNIKERLEKVVHIIPAKYAGGVQQLMNDCRYLLKLVEEKEKS